MLKVVPNSFLRIKAFFRNQKLTPLESCAAETVDVTPLSVGRILDTLNTGPVHTSSAKLRTDRSFSDTQLALTCDSLTRKKHPFCFLFWDNICLFGPKHGLILAYFGQNTALYLPIVARTRPILCPILFLI